MPSLVEGALAALGGSVPTPGYDRSRVTAGVVHFGVGGFHRAHQAMYHDRLMNEGKGLEYGICGVGVMPGDRAMKDALDAQDGLYTLVVKHADGTYEPRVIGSIVDYLFAPDDPEAVIARMAAETTRIVSLTVTEGGYDAGGAAFGFIVDALARRREQGIAPFTVMSCDNLEGNGHRTHSVVVEVARRESAELADWIEHNVKFPNSMVDRITPQTTDDDRREVQERFGIDDAWPVVCEPFTQWVLEDAFTAGRPPYEDAGVQVVDDNAPYELMKLRLLNASHQALCYFAYLDGYRLVHEAAQDPLYRTFLRGYMDEEGTPTLEPVPGVDLDDYKATLIERFSNPEVRDTVARLCAESSDRIPKWLLPVVRRNLDERRPIERSAAIVASWARYAEGTDEQGEPIEVVDRLSERLGEAARNGNVPAGRGVRRPRARRALRRRLRRGAALTARARRPQDPRALPERVAAVDDEHRAGHEARRVAGEIDDRRPHLLRQRVAAHRRVVDPQRLEPRVIDRRHLGLHVARRQRVHAHVVRRPLRRQRLRELVHGRLGRVVGRLPLRAVDDHRRDRADVDDHAAATGDHLLADHARAVPDAVDVDVEDRPPLLVGDLQRRPVKADPRVVDEDVDPADLGSTIARTLSTSVTSVITPSERDATTTSAPASRRATTSAAPIPRLPPVTTATLPSSRKASITFTRPPPECPVFAIGPSSVGCRALQGWTMTFTLPGSSIPARSAPSVSSSP